MLSWPVCPKCGRAMSLSIQGPTCEPCSASFRYTIRLSSGSNAQKPPEIGGRNA